MKNWAATLAILPLLSVSVALAEDFTTINGKTYKNATISHVEADGIVLRTKNGISKIYFVELPKDVQERFHYVTATPIAAQREREPVKVETKKDGSRQTGERSWVRALPVTAPFLRLLILGALIITCGVLVIIRSRFS